VPLVALSSDHRSLRKMALHFGVIPHEMAPPQTMLDLVLGIDALMIDRKFAAAGDRIIIVAGAALGTPGTLNGVILHTVGEQWTGEVENPSAITQGIVAQ
jgi:pyruvate kinase